MLLADTNAVGRLERQTIKTLNISVATIGATAFGGGGVGSSIEPKAQNKRKPRCLDGEKEAHSTLTCSEPPMGRWTMRMLADRMIEVGYVEAVSHETVRQR